MVFYMNHKPSNGKNISLFTHQKAFLNAYNNGQNDTLRAVIVIFMPYLIIKNEPIANYEFTVLAII